MADPMARLMAEDELLSAVLQMCRTYRWLAVHVRNSRAGITQGDPGNPDILACRPPRLLFIETKKQGKASGPLQQQWADALAKVPGIESYLWMPSDWRDGTVERVLR